VKARIQICERCRISEKSRAERRIKCPVCGKYMVWKSGIGIANGDYNHYSESMAINPSQIAEHKAAFPNVDVLPDGRIHFTSVKQQERYVDKCGFHKHVKKSKPRSVRIA